MEITLQSDNQGEGRDPTTMHGKICDAGHAQAPVPNYFIPGIDLVTIDSYHFIPFQRLKSRTTHLEITKFSFLVTFALVFIDLNCVQVIFSMSLCFFQIHLNVVLIFRGK